jgi:hypothetical protein
MVEDPRRPPAQGTGDAAHALQILVAVAELGLFTARHAEGSAS